MVHQSDTGIPIMPEACCKCAAYQEIISQLNAKVAAARVDLLKARDFYEYGTARVDSALKVLP